MQRSLQYLCCLLLYLCELWPVMTVTVWEELHIKWLVRKHQQWVSTFPEGRSSLMISLIRLAKPSRLNCPQRWLNCWQSPVSPQSNGTVPGLLQVAQQKIQFLKQQQKENTSDISIREFDKLTTEWKEIQTTNYNLYSDCIEFACIKLLRGLN